MANLAASHTFELSAIPIELEYRSVKTMRLLVYPDGRVKIAAPEGMSTEYIKKFAASKIDWIKKQRDRFLKSTAEKKRPKTGTLRNHSAMYVWGKAYELELIERRGNPKIVLEDGYMKMYVRPDSTRAKRLEYLDKWYSRILKEAAPALVKKWETVTGIGVEKLYVRNMQTHWGNCNTVSQTMRLNSVLAKRHPECLEYVIVHEMLHVIEKGHNRKFYRLLAKYIPQWKTIRKKMNSGEIQDSP